MNKPIGYLKEAKGFSKDIILIRTYSILMKDEAGEFIYTFKEKKKADEFYKLLCQKKH